MSTEYDLFFKTDEIRNVLDEICAVDGVKLDGKELHIEGLLITVYRELDASGRDIMLNDYGEYGIDVNWKISGTHNKSHDIIDLMERLFRCAAAIIKSRPDAPLSLMRNAESFYVLNTADRLTISPGYLKAIPSLASLFEKPIVVKNIG